MENNKDIGKIVRDKLQSLDKSPNDSVWLSINAELQKKKKKRRIVIFWFLSAGSALGLLLFLTLFGTSIFKQNETDGNHFQNSEKYSLENKKEDEVNKEQNTSKEKQQKTETLKFEIEKDKNEEEILALKNNKSKKSITSKNSFKNNKQKNKKDSFIGSNSKQSGLAANENNSNNQFSNFKSKDSSEILVDSSAIVKLNDSLKKPKKNKKELASNSKKEDSTETKKGTIYVFAHVNPTLFNYLSKTSVIDDRLKNNSTTSNVEYNFGVYAGVELSKKLNIRIGVNRTKLSLKTENVNIGSQNSDNVSGYFSNVDYETPITNEEISILFNDSIISVSQEVQYLEVPIEVKYKFYDKKFGMEAFAGFSTLYMQKNNVIVESNSKSLHLGSISSSKKINFSANIGIGFSYKLIDNFQLNAEPTFHYYFEPSKIPAKPYSVGLQFGLQYNFKN